VFSQSLKDHFGALEKVFSYLKDANLQVNPNKCKFVSEEVEYLGFIVTPQGMKHRGQAPSALFSCSTSKAML